jgi:malate dehydrogenase (oxaloacetate-decarboxylating)(NADP+)
MITYKEVRCLLQGLIVASRNETLQPFKKRYAHEHEPVKDLLDAVKVQG